MLRLKSIAGSLLLVGATAAGITFAGITIVQAQTSATDVIATRQAGYKATIANVGVVKKALDAGGDLTAVASNAQGVADWGHKIPTMFPPGSGQEAGVKTAALPEIWANKADFEKLAGNLAAEATKLTAALKANDKAAATTAFAATGAACGACHKTYRAKL